MRTEAATAEFLGIEFSNLSYPAVLAELDRLSRQEHFSVVVTPNVDHVVMLHDGKDQIVKDQFREAYQVAAVRLCDSRILQLLAKLKGIELKVVTGSDLTALLFRSGHLDGKRVAIIGADEAMLAELKARFVAIDLIQHIPPMGVLKNPKAMDEIEEFIASQGCNYVLFAIGAPQSEIIANRCLNAHRSKGVALCVGASIEFVLGRKARAPVWMQKAHLEWAFRLISEPRRLWRRYLVSGPRIFRLTFFGGHMPAPKNAKT